MCKNSKKRKCGYLIRIGVKFWGKFGGWVETYPREGDDKKKRRIRKERIFGQVNHYTSLGVWKVLWYSYKHSWHKRNTIHFDGEGHPLTKLYGVGNIRVIGSPSTPYTSLIYNLIVNYAELLMVGGDNPTSSFNTNIMDTMDTMEKLTCTDATLCVKDIYTLVPWNGDYFQG